MSKMQSKPAAVCELVVKWSVLCLFPQPLHGYLSVNAGFPLLSPPLQIPVPCSHRGTRLPEFLASYPRGVGDGRGRTSDLECSYVTSGSDQMGLSANIQLIPFLLVKVYHGSGSVDSARPSGGLCSGCNPGGKSLKITWTLVHFKQKFTLSWQSDFRREKTRLDACLFGSSFFLSISKCCV